MNTPCVLFSLALCAPMMVAWSQEVPAGTNAPLARTVAWHGPQGDILLHPSLLFARADPHYAVFPMSFRRDRHQAVVREGRVSIPEPMPSLAVQGFGPGTDWTLVRLAERDGVDVVHIVSRSPWGDGFFSDTPFSAHDIVAVTQSAAGDRYTLRPAAPLSPGGYILCGKPSVDQGGWARVCYDFQVTGSGS